MRALARPAVRRSGLVALAFALGGLSAGCGPSKTEVTGKVSHNGKPVVYGSVTLIGSDGIVYSGQIKEDGTFVIPGVPTGPVKIGVLSPNPKPPEAGKASAKDDLGGFSRGDRRPPPLPESVVRAWFPIPEKYGDPMTSGLTETVSRGQPLNINLK
ncbi:MAG TPA: carboxypeptidase-like regulatory domain-containing protein [Gemmataceae bacterium]|nr:carboxypeptidase-like regulatory domain-containing protein [Gemmataceae bacterium]